MNFEKKRKKVEKKPRNEAKRLAIEEKIEKIEKNLCSGWEEKEYVVVLSWWMIWA